RSRARLHPRRARRGEQPAAARRANAPAGVAVTAARKGPNGSAAATRTLLELDDVSVEYALGDRVVRAVDGVSVSVAPGERLGIAGESGSGKSTLANAILQILKPPAQLAGGRVLFEGRDLAAMKPDELRRFRWRHVSLVFQSAMDVLNPVMRVGDQFVDMLKAHEKDRKSTRLNSSHVAISYAVFCLKKKKYIEIVI